MSTTQIFLLVNVTGGVAVLGSYIFGFLVYPHLRMKLWGGLGRDWRRVFAVSMVISAAGYLLFLSYMVLGSGLEGFEEHSVYSPHSLSILCAIFLASSSVWMPSTLAYLNKRGTIWWGITVLSLWVTSISLILLTSLVLVGASEEKAFGQMMSMLGIMYLTGHCAFLDAVVWVRRFPKV